MIQQMRKILIFKEKQSFDDAFLKKMFSIVFIICVLILQ